MNQKILNSLRSQNAQHDGVISLKHNFEVKNDEKEVEDTQPLSVQNIMTAKMMGSRWRMKSKSLSLGGRLKEWCSKIPLFGRVIFNKEIIHPFEPTKINWDLIIAFLLVYCLLEIPVKVSS